eukprot:TRINITY_DN12890_c0_g1_i10.p1 TRINITY_DN12890_c0_g1~~TRINITY_DN12890_c0_g1_i10.p1  ORF type:complete len:236 (+),score=65.69 TRINITY_DN12890_c0_g1_i10:98-805(+)
MLSHQIAYTLMDANNNKLKEEMEDNVSILKSFLSLDLSVDPNLYSNNSAKPRDMSKERKVSKKKLNKFITSDDDFEPSDSEQIVKELFDFNPIREEEEEAKNNISIPHYPSKPKMSKENESENSTKKFHRVPYYPPKNDYKPRINSVSKRLAMTKSSEKKRANVWEYLHSLDKELKEKHDQTYLEKKLQEEEDSLKGCTFQPKKSARGYTISDASFREEDVYKRCQQWKQNAEEK